VGVGAKPQKGAFQWLNITTPITRPASTRKGISPATFSLKEHSLEEIANTMAKSELDHWVNEAISVSTIFFSTIWGQFWIFLITALCAMAFDSQFIIMQRYNRPRILIAMQKEKKKSLKQDTIILNK